MNVVPNNSKKRKNVSGVQCSVWIEWGKNLEHTMLANNHADEGLFIWSIWTYDLQRVFVTSTRRLCQTKSVVDLNKKSSSMKWRYTNNQSDLNQHCDWYCMKWTTNQMEGVFLGVYTHYSWVRASAGAFIKPVASDGVISLWVCKTGCSVFNSATNKHIFISDWPASGFPHILDAKCHRLNT